MGKKKAAEPQKDPTAAPGWALTFGDLMTQLLTFFILLFSVSEVKKEKIYEVFQSFKTHFNMDVPNMGYTIESFYNELKALSEPYMNPPTNNRGDAGKSPIKVEKRFSVNSEVEALRKVVKVTIAGKVCFDPGSAVLKEEAKEILDEIGVLLIGDQLEKEIIGHTDSFPLSSTDDATDHLELGYMRAKAVADYFMHLWEKKECLEEEATYLKISTQGKTDPPPDPLGDRNRVEINVISATENTVLD